MDVVDQLTMLATASSMSKTMDHAYFSFTQTPYDASYEGLLSVKPSVTLDPRNVNDTQAKNVNIFESVFLIDASFPAYDNVNDSKIVNKRTKRYSNVKEFTNLHSIITGKRVTAQQDSRNELTVISESNTPSGQLAAREKIENSRSFNPNFNNTDISNSVNRTNITNVLSTNNTYRENGDVKLSNQTQFWRNLVNSQSTRKTENQNVEKSDVMFDNEKSENESKFNLTDQVSSLSPRLNLKKIDPSKSGAQTLFFKSEFNSLREETKTYFDASKQRASKLVAKFRRKRNTETFMATDADLDAVHDIVFLVAYAVHLHGNLSTAAPFSEDLITTLVNLTFPGTTGQFKVDEQQLVCFDFSVFDFNSTSGAFEPRIFFRSMANNLWELKERQTIVWPGGVALSGDDCFKQAANCNEGMKDSIIAAIVTSAIVVVGIIVLAVAFFRRYWQNKEMTKGPNKVILSSEDLIFVLQKDVGKGSRLMKSRVTIMDKDNAPDLIRGSDPNRSMASINELSDYTETARFNGDLVHVKELDIKGFEMKSKLLTFIRLCRDLRHENLNPYVGFLANSIRPAIVMEYCSRGSLYDIVHNEDFKLDWDFKLSLLTDLVRGVRYLHSSTLKFHGHMTSKNCVIDSRFVLKITDYGVSGIMERCKAFKVLEMKDMLWSAPELLRDLALLQRGTDKGDIYAMAIIFQEVALRTEPYSTTGLTPEEIVKKLKKPPPLIRPSVTPQAAPPQFIQVMKQCWSEMPEMRPNIDDVYDQFKKLTGGKKANIVDTMFKMLEKYSTDLEDIVAERTMQLEEEKKKTDQLLFRMLPSTVAESLKLGRNVEAEVFDEVTIYFSDIVGFTTISAMSTPMQVVDLLNDLYSMFDATINNHDVYKVETIGDAYMVVSGLPIRNGNRHAGEIGTLALVLLSQCGQFTIRHMAHVPLRLRIGLHTGSCVAGVVGLTMPRFCLFGDTVNTASRMESSGAAFRIHISEACKLVLDDLGGYKVEYRGQTELKGKGLHNTYWLTGKEGFDKNLPEPPPLNGDNTHGLESVMGDLKLDLTPESDVSTSGPTMQSTSENNLATTSATSASNSIDAFSNDNNNTSNRPVDDSETSKYKQGKNTNISVVADINIHEGGAKSELTHDNQVIGTSSNTPYQNRHSESNDSGFGSERKHSQGNDGFSYGNANGGKVSETHKRTNQQSSNRFSVTSSSDISLHNSLQPSVDVGDDLATVTEV